MKTVHLLNTDKFVSSYIQFVNFHFRKEEHLFIIIGDTSHSKLNFTNDDNVVNIKEIQRGLSGLKSILFLFNTLASHRKVIIHSFFIPRIINLLFIQPWALRKCYWVMWGGDLYQYREKKHNFKEKLFELRRKYIIKNLGGLITQIEGDYKLAEKWYGAKGKHYYSFMYPSNLYKEYDLSKVNKPNDVLVIQLGNSADPSNSHIEILEKLSVFKNQSMEIICPLSYGNIQYANNVIERGKELFGEKFTPLTEFMAFEEYLKILAKIDVAIFNHNRQQAVGNITTLLGLGKKVYIRKDITTWVFCEDHGLKVYSLEKEFEKIFEPISRELRDNNIKMTKKHFSKEKLVADLNKIFKDT